MIALKLDGRGIRTNHLPLYLAKRLSGLLSMLFLYFRNTGLARMNREVLTVMK